MKPQQIDVEVDVVDPQMEMERTQERLQAFGQSLSSQRDEWIRARYSYGVDKRWLEDEDQYNAKDNIAKQASQMMTSVEQGYPITTRNAKPNRSTVFVGVTRQKTNAAEALQRLRAAGATILAVHHDLASVRAHFDDAVVLHGTVRAHGRAGDVLAESAVARVFGFSGADGRAWAGTRA